MKLTEKVIGSLYGVAIGDGMGGSVEGWTPEEIWDHNNLQLMGKSCNARKGHLTYDEQGRLPVMAKVSKVDKSARTPVCNLCESGRLLLEGEVCELCNSGPQPAAFPRYAQKRPKDCSHGFEDPSDHCWMCVIGFEERKSATMTIIEGP